MKTKFHHYFIVVLFLANATANSQSLDSYPTEKSNKLVDDNVFDDLILNDLNFLILGENTPQQGIELTFDEDKSKIKLSGYVDKLDKLLITLDGDFSVDKGVYFFDENGGSKKSKITANFYVPFLGSRWYDSLDDSKGKTQRAFIKKAIFQKDSLNSIYRQFIELQALMEKYELPIDKTKKVDAEINERVKNENIVADVNSREEKYKLKVKGKDKLLTIEKLDKKSVILDSVDVTLNGIINNIKLIEDYEKIISKLDSINEISKKKQLEIAENVWTAKRMFFVGFSPFYQRENINIYKPNENFTTFEENFSNTNGDIFGVSSSFNYFFQKNNKKKSNIANYFIGRILVDFSRSSNIDSFKKRTFGLSEPTGGSVNDEPINNITSVEGYLGTNDYAYGFRQAYNVELYYSFISQLGLFGNIGYNKTSYSSNEIGYEEKFPMRLGFLFNLKSKDSVKNLLTVQLFADRTNLNLKPTGEKGDLKFGFKIGLPFNIRKKV